MMACAVVLLAVLLILKGAFGGESKKIALTSPGEYKPYPLVGECVCMCMCSCICVYIYMFVYLCVYIYVCVSVYVCVWCVCVCVLRHHVSLRL
jgi:hypothetical protein